MVGFTERKKKKKQQGRVGRIAATRPVSDWVMAVQTPQPAGRSNNSYNIGATVNMQHFGPLFFTL